MRFFIASGCPIATTSLYRCVHLSEQLHSLGQEARVVDWFDETRIDPASAVGYDAVVLYRLPMSAPLSQVIKAARTAGVPAILDTDDLIFEPELVYQQRAVAQLSTREQAQHVEGVGRYLQTLQACDAVTTATPFLAELVRRRGKQVFVHRNALGNEMLAAANRLQAKRSARVPSERVVIGYGSGTATHDTDFSEAAPALRTILDQFPATELWLVGPVAISSELEAFGTRVRRFPLTDWQGWFERAGQFDIALGPLEMENVFCRAKSEIKFVEAGALGVPLVASRTEPFTEVLAPGENGLLASNKEEWTEALRSLVENPGRRTQIGKSARASVLRRYAPEIRAAELAQLLPRLLGAREDNVAARV